MSGTGDEDARRGIYRLGTEERLALARALLRQPNRAADGREAMRQAYPHAPAEMIDTAVHHLYVDAPEAEIDFMAEAELAIRDPSRVMSEVSAVHLLSHVYNWLQFRALLPEGKTGLLERLGELEEAVRQDDREMILESVRELRDMLDGSLSPPDFG